MKCFYNYKREKKYLKSEKSLMIIRGRKNIIMREKKKKVPKPGIEPGTFRSSV